LLGWLDVGEKLSDLVGIHARGGNLDGAGPVVVVMAEVESELLDRILLDRGVIESDVEVSGEDTSLSGVLRNKIEVVLHVGILVFN